MTPQLLLALRWAVAGLACLTAGATLTVMVRYLAATWRNGRKAPGRILARHVAEVSAGTCGLVSGYAIAVLGQLGATELLSATGRLWLYLGAMLLLFVGVIDVGHYQRRRLAADRGGRHHR